MARRRKFLICATRAASRQTTSIRSSTAPPGARAIRQGQAIASGGAFVIRATRGIEKQRLSIRSSPAHRPRRSGPRAGYRERRRGRGGFLIARPGRIEARDLDRGLDALAAG
jgi:hypothetical protein